MPSQEFCRRAVLVALVGFLVAGASSSLAANRRTSRLALSRDAAVGGFSTTFQRVPGAPFGVATSPDGRYAFVDLVQGRVLVYSLAGHVPRLLRTIDVPGSTLGCSLTRDGRLLLVADNKGAAVISVMRAESDASDPVLGTLRPPPSARPQADGAIETATSATGQYVFVSLEYGNPNGQISVYDIGSDQHPRFSIDDYVGAITLGAAVVGSALSPDGRYLYVTSEIGGRSTNTSDGTLSVISISTAEHRPDKAVVAVVAAQAQPVRVVVSPDGSTVWVTARASNRVLAFSAPLLLTHPSEALLAQVKVGTAPVGLALFDHGAGLIVAESDRFDAQGAHAALTVVNTRSALAKRPAVIASLSAGQFPREIAIEPHDRTALVTNFGSGQLETVQLSSV